MAILKIYKYPHPVLRVTGSTIRLPVDAQSQGYWHGPLQQLIDDMIETMYACPGAIGLAAPQVGHSLQLFVMDMSVNKKKNDTTAPDSDGEVSGLRILINPVITQQSRNKVMREGCLSFPEFLASVKRATRLTCEAYDRVGKLQTYDVRELEAIAIQHEIDHLNGILMIDRVASLKTDLIRRQVMDDHQSE